MTRDTDLLSAKRFDLLVVGGGICGLACAYDAAQRGMSVALVERGDFGSATSFNHAKTVHGGLRSLQTADLRKAREAIVERRTLARIAPHLVEPLPFLIGTYRGFKKSRLALGVGFAVDRTLGWDRNAGVESRLRLAAGRLVSKAECASMFPHVDRDGLTGGALWHDYQMADADRLTFAFAEAASCHGATLANYVEATGLRTDRQHVRGVTAVDRLVGATAFDIEAAVTIVAAGAWTPRLLRTAGVSLDLPFIKAMNVVTNRPTSAVAIGAPTSGGRLLLSMPWKGRALMGTSHAERPCAAGDTHVTGEELDAFIAELNSAFPALGLAPMDVTLVHRGAVPATACADGSYTLRTHAIVRDHAADGGDGVVSLIGVKYTTARAVAERAVDIACRKLGRPTRPCQTAITPLPAARDIVFDEATRQIRRSPGVHDNAEVAEHLVRAYGVASSRVLALGDGDPALLRRVSGRSPVLGAELVHAVRDEMACTLTDAVVRRTPLGSAGYPGDDVVTTCAEIVGDELGWSSTRRNAEVEALRAFYAPIGVGSRVVWSQ